MAKPKAEKTAAAKQHEKLKAELKAAKQAAAKQDNAQTQKRVKDAITALAPITTTVNRERFMRVANVRAAKALSGIKGLQGVANPRSYQFTQADADKVCALLEAELKALRTRFASALSSPGATKTAKAGPVNLFEEPAA